MSTAAERATWKALAEGATEGPWSYNSYSAIFGPFSQEYEDWEEARIDEGHTLEGKHGAPECPVCGPWTWDCTNERTGKVTTYDGRGCKLYSECYEREQIVAYVPAHHGDTATGRRVADAKFIEAAREAVPALLADVERLERENQRLTHLLGSHADGHRCTCECVRLADYVQMTPSEWEQDPWCPTHPEVDQLRAEFDALQAENRRLREADL